MRKRWTSGKRKGQSNGNVHQRDVFINNVMIERFIGVVVMLLQPKHITLIYIKCLTDNSNSIPYLK